MNPKENTDNFIQKFLSAIPSGMTPEDFTSVHIDVPVMCFLSLEYRIAMQEANKFADNVLFFITAKDQNGPVRISYTVENIWAESRYGESAN